MIASIYKITDKDGLVYYGSTKRPLQRRLCQHKVPSANDTMSRTMDKNSMVIEALEQYYFDEDTYNKKFIEKRERSYIDGNPCINKVIPGRTKKESYKEYREKNKESLNEYNKEYREKNKDVIKEREKGYREKNKEVIKEKNKVYHEKNKEAIIERQKVYREKNKEYKKEKLGCRTCKCMISRGDFARHTKSKKHQSNLSLGGSTATKS